MAPVEKRNNINPPLALSFCRIELNGMARRGIELWPLGALHRSNG
jgi:hypothetical protein